MGALFATNINRTLCIKMGKGPAARHPLKTRFQFDLTMPSTTLFQKQCLRLARQAAQRSPTVSAHAMGARRSRMSSEPRRMRSAILVAATKKCGVFFSTSTGHTEEVAEYIADKLGSEAQEIGDVDVSDLAGFDSLVVGAPTWNTDADESRSATAWDDVLPELGGVDLKGKPVAVFGLGDSVSYGDYFCDAIEEVYDTFADAGCKMVGEVSTDDYEYSNSKSVRDGKFLGLALDEDNESEKTEERCDAWIDAIKPEIA